MSTHLEAADTLVDTTIGAEAGQGVHPEAATDMCMDDALARMCEQALAAVTRTQQRIEQAKRDLWGLTAAARPDADRIAAKVREIDRLSHAQQSQFVRAVVEAAVLGRRSAMQAGPDSVCPSCGRLA